MKNFEYSSPIKFQVVNKPGTSNLIGSCDFYTDNETVAEGMFADINELFAQKYVIKCYGGPEINNISATKGHTPSDQTIYDFVPGPVSGNEAMYEIVPIAAPRITSSLSFNKAIEEYKGEAGIELADHYDNPIDTIVETKVLSKTPDGNEIVEVLNIEQEDEDESFDAIRLNDIAEEPVGTGTTWKYANIEEFKKSKIIQSVHPMYEKWKDSLAELLWRYRHITYVRTEPSNILPCDINLKDNPKEPILEGFRQVYVGTPEFRDEVHRTFGRLINNGILVKVNRNDIAGRFTHRVIIVKKNNGKLRITIDLRSLNKIVKVPETQIPNIELYMDKFLGGVVWFTIDLPDYYFQIPITTKSRRFINIRGPDGELYELTRLPMGFAGAVGEAMKALNIHVLQYFHNIAGFIMDGYLDDLAGACKPLFAGEPIESIVQRYFTALEKLFKRLEDAGLRLPPDFEKCLFLQATACTLGMELDGRSYRIDPSRIKDFYELKVPGKPTRDFLRTMIATFGYYRKFATQPSFLQALEVLQQLSNDTATRFLATDWKEVHSKAFYSLRDMIIANVARAIIDFSKPLFLH